MGGPEIGMDQPTTRGTAAGLALFASLIVANHIVGTPERNLGIETPKSHSSFSKSPCLDVRQGSYRLPRGWPDDDQGGLRALLDNHGVQYNRAPVNPRRGGEGWASIDTPQFLGPNPSVRGPWLIVWAPLATSMHTSHSQAVTGQDYDCPCPVE